MRYRSPALIVGLFALMAGCENREPVASPSSTSAIFVTSASATASTAVVAPDPACRTLGGRMIYPARWSPAERDAVMQLMRERIAVLAIDECKAVRLLAGCKVRGHYGYLGTVRRSRTVPLLTEEERRVNAPLLAAAKEQDPSAIQLDLLSIGQWGTIRKFLLPGELEGECEGATHFVTRADIGAATISSAGALAPAPRDACSGARPLDAVAPPGCNELVELRAEAISEREGLMDTQEASKRAAVVELGMCPKGMVISAERCTSPPVQGAHLCKLGDLEDCKRQCEQNHTDSCDLLGFMHLHGRGVKRDVKAAERAYTKSCSADDGIACNTLGQLWVAGELGKEDRAKAADFFDRACNAGEIVGCVNVANAMLTGLGRPKDPAKGLALLERACTAGDACEAFASALARGDAGKPDAARARVVLEEPCSVHYGPACAALGRLHYLGEGGPADRTKASSYFEQACRDHDQSACVGLALQYRQGDGVKKDDVRATKLLSDACNAGDPSACLNLGIAYEHGKGIAKDEAKAAELFESACESKNGTACAYFADFLRVGTGVKTDLARAKAMYARACKLGYEQACAQQ